MISIPVAVATPHFKWQISLFEYQHFKVYGKDAINKAIIPIVKRNFRYQEKINDVDWGLKLPYRMVESVLDLYDLNDEIYIPSNCYTAIKQILSEISDDECIEILDADMPHIRPYNGYIPKDDEILADDRYESWHMHIVDENGDNRNIIQKYLKHNDSGYMNGGSNIIAKASTMKKIIDEVIDVGLQIGLEHKGTKHSWWQSMYAINVACHNNRIKMISRDGCYFPNINELDDKHHIVHYSCDPIFNKSQFPLINIKEFPNNAFYNAVKSWIYEK
jgi:hypothetical protein